MAEFRDRYESRVVIYDVPPLLDGADALAVLPRIDCALLVIREGRTSSKEIAAVKRVLQGTAMVGAVVNHGRHGFGGR